MRHQPLADQVRTATCNLAVKAESVRAAVASTPPSTNFILSFIVVCWIVAALTVHTEAETDGDATIERQILVTHLTTAREVVRVLLSEVCFQVVCYWCSCWLTCNNVIKHWRDVKKILLYVGSSVCLSRLRLPCIAWADVRQPQRLLPLCHGR